MPRRFKRYAAAFSLPFMLGFMLPLFEGGDGGGAGGDDGKPGKPDLNDDQQKWVNSQIAAERRETEARIRAQLKTESETAQQQAQAEQDRLANEAKGEYETAKTALTKERDEAFTTRDALKSENEIYAKHFEAQYEARVKAVPETVWAELKPADDAPLTERLAAIEKAEKIAALVSSDKKPAAPAGTRPLPTGDSNGPTFEEQVARQSRKSAYS